jgi:GntR family transcriptional regulator/MocR family aminotransferase
MVTILGENAGLHMMVRFHTEIPDVNLMTKAEQVGVGLIAASPLYLGRGPGHEFIFSYAELDESAISSGVARLVTVFS